jgi:hypothetical protein
LEVEYFPSLCSNLVKTEVANPPLRNVGILYDLMGVIFNKVGRDSSDGIATHYGDRSPVSRTGCFGLSLLCGNNLQERDLPFPYKAIFGLIGRRE